METGVPELTLTVCLAALAFIVGFVAGLAAARHPKPEPDPAASDVRTPGHKLVAMPTACGTPMRTLKPSSAWPRKPGQRVQSQIERHTA